MTKPRLGDRVLLVDDMVDSGHTLEAVLQGAAEALPAHHGAAHRGAVVEGVLGVQARLLRRVPARQSLDPPAVRGVRQPAPGGPEGTPRRAERGSRAKGESTMRTSLRWLACWWRRERANRLFPGRHAAAARRLSAAGEPDRDADRAPRAACPNVVPALYTHVSTQPDVADVRMGEPRGALQSLATTAPTSPPTPRRGRSAAAPRGQACWSSRTRRPRRLPRTADRRLHHRPEPRAGQHGRRSHRSRHHPRPRVQHGTQGDRRLRRLHRAVGVQGRRGRRQLRHDGVDAVPLRMLRDARRQQDRVRGVRRRSRASSIRPPAAGACTTARSRCSRSTSLPASCA